MAVFTEVSFDEADQLLQSLGLGALQSFEGCAGGIENTNYFADTEQGRWVLTLFERLNFEQLPFYLNLMKHLAGRGIPVPDPQASPVVVSRKGKSEVVTGGEILHRLKDKPAAVVNRLPGKSELAPTALHCQAVGDMLARMHLAGGPALSDRAAARAHPGRTGFSEPHRGPARLPQPATRPHPCRLVP